MKNTPNPIKNERVPDADRQGTDSSVLPPQDTPATPDNVGDVQRSVDKPVAKLPLIDKIDSKQEEKLTETGRETPEQKPISEISEPESSQNKKTSRG